MNTRNSGKYGSDQVCRVPSSISNEVPKYTRGFHVPSYF